MPTLNGTASSGAAAAEAEAEAPGAPGEGAFAPEGWVDSTDGAVSDAGGCCG
ncbi:MAG: hypothetical protein HUU21_38570 [Polyangiaceae bacterium]|nr:hypothetical protein [Polyangiaceae bacterium]